MKQRFEVILLDEVWELFDTIDEKTRLKIIYNIDKSTFQNDPELFKKLDNEIWEFRTKYNKSHYRIFAFWDKSDNKKTLVIATHGILKKTDKTPIKEIEKAKSMMKQYFENKIKK